jgi:hypothetical protein
MAIFGPEKDSERHGNLSGKEIPLHASNEVDVTSLPNVTKMTQNV